MLKIGKLLQFKYEYENWFQLYVFCIYKSEATLIVDEVATTWLKGRRKSKCLNIRKRKRADKKGNKYE